MDETPMTAPTSPQLCPKCGASVGGDHCPKCGLAAARFAGFAPQDAVSESLQQMLSELEAHWDDEAQHEQFVAQCFAQGVPGFAAACYQRRGDDPTAQRRLHQIEQRVLLTMAATRRTEEAPTRPRGMLPVLIALLLLGVALLGVLFLYTQGA
jgi:hypothetical protein